MNPMNLLKAFMGKGGNPMQFVMEAMGVNKNPIFDNLIQMAQKGDNKGVETFARNYFKGQGKDFDKEYGEFMKMVNKK